MSTTEMVTVEIPNFTIAERRRLRLHQSPSLDAFANVASSARVPLAPLLALEIPKREIPSDVEATACSRWSPDTPSASHSFDSVTEVDTADVDLQKEPRLSDASISAERRVSYGHVSSHKAETSQEAIVEAPAPQDEQTIESILEAYTEIKETKRERLASAPAVRIPFSDNVDHGPQELGRHNRSWSVQRILPDELKTTSKLFQDIRGIIGTDDGLECILPPGALFHAAQSRSRNESTSTCVDEEAEQKIAGLSSEAPDIGQSPQIWSDMHSRSSTLASEDEEQCHGCCKVQSVGSYLSQWDNLAHQIQSQHCHDAEHIKDKLVHDPPSLHPFVLLTDIPSKTSEKTARKFRRNAKVLPFDGPLIDGAMFDREGPEDTLPKTIHAPARISSLPRSKKVVFAVQEKGINVTFASSPPFSPLLLGRSLPSSRTKLPSPTRGESLRSSFFHHSGLRRSQSTGNFARRALKRYMT